MSSCVVCGTKFKAGEYLQAFLRSPDDPLGSWTDPVLIDDQYQTRASKNKDSVKRKHLTCNIKEK